MFDIISIVRHDLMKPGKLACLFVWPEYIGEIEVGQLCLKVCVCFHFNIVYSTLELEFGFTPPAG